MGISRRAAPSAVYSVGDVEGVYVRGDSAEYSGCCPSKVGDWRSVCYCADGCSSWVNVSKCCELGGNASSVGAADESISTSVG